MGGLRGLAGGLGMLLLLSGGLGAPGQGEQIVYVTGSPTACLENRVFAYIPIETGIASHLKAHEVSEKRS